MIAVKITSTLTIRCLVIVSLLCFGCTHQSDKTNVKATLTDSNHALQIDGIDKLIMQDIARDSANVWQTLIPVYKMPADTDMKDFQTAQPGKYIIRDSVLVFRPDTPFQKGQTYFARYYLYTGTKSAWQYVIEKKQRGSIKYKDLLFRY